MADPDCFVKGFVVIHGDSSQPLDVVGVYSGQRVLDGNTTGVGHTIEVDTIDSRPLDLSTTPPESPSLYAAKYACGSEASADLTDATVPGEYFTAINVHNPNNLYVPVTDRFVWAQSELEGTPWPVASGPGHYMMPDGSFEIDCQDIASVLFPAGGPPFFKGWVILWSTYELDVFGVYYSTEALNIASAPHDPNDGGVGLSMDIEPVEKSVVPPPISGPD
jgi:hypothetical protein